MSEEEEKSQNKVFLVKCSVKSTQDNIPVPDILDVVEAETPEEAKDIFTAMVSDLDYMPEKFQFVFDKDALVRTATILNR